MLKKDLKKNLLRAKQYAEQTFGRGGQSEVLGENLEQIDRRITYMKTACHNTYKKIGSTVRDAGQEREKRMRKLPEKQVAIQMQDAGKDLGQETLMGNLFSLASDAEHSVSEYLMDCEMETENRVLAPLHSLSEQQIPLILKKKKQLEDLVYHYDAIRKKYVSACERHQGQPGGNVRIENAKEEMDDAQNKVEQCRDQLSTDMFSFSAKENENSKFLLEYIQIQADYHEQALKALTDVLPRMKEACDQNNQVPAYGTSLEEYLRRTDKEIASVIETCVAILIEDAMQEEGLFRIAGAANKVKKVRAAFDAGLDPDMSEIRDIHCIAGALKSYLRELPEPLLTYNLYNEWMDAAHLQHEEKMQSLWLLCERLPKANYNNLRYLIKFLSKLSENQDMNKMSPSNIAIVIGPNLLWQRDVGQSVLTTSSQSAIVEALISHADYFFPGEIVFETVKQKNSPVPLPRKQQQRASVPAMPVSKSRSKSKQKASVDLGSIALANQSAVHENNNNPQIYLIPNNTSPPSDDHMVVDNKSDTKKEDIVDNLTNIDDGGMDSANGPYRSSFRQGWPVITSHPHRSGTIVESNNPVQSDGRSTGENYSGMVKSLNLVNEQSIKRAITPPPKATPPRSVHCDMYDTLFALQSLQQGGGNTEESNGDGSTVSDYLTKVRNLWDCNVTPYKRYSIGIPHTNGNEDISDGENLSDLGRDRARASSESRILEAARHPQHLHTIAEGPGSRQGTLEKNAKPPGTKDNIFNLTSEESNKYFNKEPANTSEPNLLTLEYGQQPIVPKRKKKSPNKEVEFWPANASDKSRDSDNTDPFIVQPPVVNHSNSLTKSSSGNNLLADIQSQDTSKDASPMMARKVTKKPAPLPPTIDRPAPPPPAHVTAGPGPGSTASLDRHQSTGISSVGGPGSTGSLERRERPPTADKPLHIVTTGDVKPPAAVSIITPPPDRPPIPDRPSLGPPPAPPTKQDNTGSNITTSKPDCSISPGAKPERPRLPSDRPQVPPPEKPTVSPSYDTSNKTITLPYPSRPDNAPGLTTAGPVSPNPNRAGSGNKPPRPSNPPPAPHKSRGGSKGSEKDFHFLKDEQQQGPAVPVRTSSQENSSEKSSGGDGDSTSSKEPPQTPTSPACDETHL